MKKDRTNAVPLLIGALEQDLNPRPFRSQAAR